VSAATAHRAGIRIGGVGVAVRTRDAAFRELLEHRFAGFLDPSGPCDYEFDVDIAEPVEGAPDDDVRVYRSAGGWRIERGDFRATLDPQSRRGRISQSANPYSIDSVLRIVHTLALAPEGGCLLHAASVVRGGRAHVFTGPSGAGKTTLARLAPPDARVLTDEVSYLRRDCAGHYVAYGTPFAGELARAGENVSAPLAAIYLLRHASANRLSPVAPAEAARAILANVLFFAEDAALVRAVFAGALELAAGVAVHRLEFAPDARVGELI
jgi:hypothetical protein